VGNVPLHWAAVNNSKECMELLLAHGAYVTIKDDVSKSDRNDSYYDMIDSRRLNLL